MHSIDGDRRRKYLVLHGLEVCATTWYLIHGIPKSTFHIYVQRYNKGVLSTAHGNKGCKRPWIGTVQVMDTIATIVKENADQMPYQMQRNRTWKSGHFEISSCRQQLEASDG